MNKILLIVFIFPALLLGQKSHTDSLLTLIEKDKEDTNKVIHLYKLCTEYYFVSNYDTALYYGNVALKLAQQLNFQKGIANIYNTFGVIYWNKGDYSKTLDYYLKSLRIKEKLGNKSGIASTLGNIGNVYLQQGDYPKTLDYYFKALKITEELSDQSRIATHLGNIGIVYDQQGDYPKALDYYFKALKMAEEIGDKRGIATHRGNIGGVYYNQADYPKALDYFLRALKMAEEVGNRNVIAANLGNIGMVYKAKEDYPKALDYYFKTLKIAEELEDQNRIAIWLGNIGALYTKVPSLPMPANEKKNGFSVAEKYLLRSLSIASEIHSLEGIKEGNQCLSELYEKTGRPVKALEHYKQYTIATDSIFNMEKEKDITRKEMNFDFEKKEAFAKAEQEKKDAISKEEKQKQTIIRNSFIGGFVFVMALALLILRGYRNKQKANIIITKQKDEVEQAKAIIEHQKHLVEEKHKEITDSINYAERIQRSFLATKKLLDDNLRNHFVFFQPKDVVSGDFYWASKLSNNNFVLATADSTGHGVPGAIMSILNISSLEKAVEQGLLEPSEIFNNTRKTIIERLKKDGSEYGGKDGMDCSLISFDFKKSKLTYSAANNPVWIVRDNQILELAPDKMPVGKGERDMVLFTQHEINLQKGDVVYALTDGMPDQFGGPRGKKFMYKKLKELLISIAHLPMPEQKETLKTEFNNWKGDLEQVDDVCLIGVRV